MNSRIREGLNLKLVFGKSLSVARSITEEVG
jgi:hypothetical protein